MKNWGMLVFISLFILSACSLEYKETQSIKIEIYEEVEKNEQLLQELIDYDMRYIAHNVPSINEENSSGINLAYFKSAVGKMPSYRITYDLNNPSVKNNINALKTEFEEFIPKLAKMHSSKASLFKKLSPLGRTWSSSIFERSAADILENSSDLLKGSMTEEEFNNILTTLNDQLGKLSSTSYIRGQYYEAFEDVPTSVSLFYLQQYTKGKSIIARISLAQEGGEWKVIGFGFYPQA